MLRNILLPTILMILGYGFWISPEFKEISAGVAVFLFGMLTLEQGFKAFSGGTLENILKKSTDKLYKSIGFGFIATAMMQSSSLVSVLTISFLGAGLIGLFQGVGIIFGANIGTTTGAWLMAGFGLKIHIAQYAMPMLAFGVVLIFQKAKSLKGIGYILAGLGFLFLGIHFMKGGFETFSSTIDLAAYSVPGFKGMMIFIGIGVLATVVMQSSHATIVLILAALAVNQITYENGIALVIGANIGTTITAIIGSLSSNIDGKRLAGAHLIFNIITAIIAVAIMGQMIDTVAFLSDHLGIASDNHTLRLAVFDSLFKIMGVVVFIPFTQMLVNFLERVLKDKNKVDTSVETSLYLNKSALELPDTAIAAIVRETRHMYENAFEIIAHGLNLNRHDIVSDKSFEEIVKHPYSSEEINIDHFYKMKIKGVYGEIVDFATAAQQNMSEDFNSQVYKLKLAVRDISEAVKDTKHLQKNIQKYLKSENENIRQEYQGIQKSLAELLRYVDIISKSDQEDEILVLIQKAELHIEQNDVIKNGNLDKLIRNNLITNEMSTSLMNDMGYVSDITKNMLTMSEIVFIQDLSNESENDIGTEINEEQKNGN